jgi:pSer/pThr/pTyr-binding forkhead associated (FHA) protein
MACPQCGHPTQQEDHFCGACGAPLGVGDGIDSTSISLPVTGPGTGSGSIASVGSGRQLGLPGGQALLVVHRGPGEGAEYPLDARAGVVRVGRSSEAEVFLDDVTVSRHHAELRHGAEGWSIRDVGSLNGTYVNRVRVEDQRLSGGDEVQIGKFRFVFLVGLESS